MLGSKVSSAPTAMPARKRVDVTGAASGDRGGADGFDDGKRWIEADMTWPILAPSSAESQLRPQLARVYLSLSGGG